MVPEREVRGPAAQETTDVAKTPAKREEVPNDEGFPETQLPATQKSPVGGIPAELLDEALADAGKGVSTAADDRIVPFLSILQDGSPQVKPREAKYVDGAEAGMVLLNGVNRLLDGEGGFIFQPCFFSKAWVEWVPRKRGGGFVARYAEQPADARKITVRGDDGKDREMWRNERDNDLIETRYHVGHIIDGDRVIPAVISLSSTGHTSSRQWMELMNEFKARGKPVPSWFRTYLVQTTERSNPSGAWFVYKFAHDDWVRDADLRAAGKALYESLSSGAMVVAEDEGDGAAAAGSNHVDDDGGI